MAETVLVLGDNHSFGESLISDLGAGGYRCIHALNADDALGALHSDAPDAVIISLPIPGGPSAEFIDQIKGVNPYAVVLAIGERGSERRAIKTLRLGADDFIQKPCAPDLLVSTLKKHLRKVARDKMLAHVDHPDTGHADQLMRQICVDAPAAIVHVDSEGIIRFSNRAATKTLGRSASDIVGYQIGAFVSERIRKEFLEHLHQQAKRPNGFSGELHLLRGDGEWFPARVKAVERPEKGHLLMVIDDLTSQKALEKHLYDSKRLASLGHVVEGVAHEVRNPLISIGGFARKLNKTAAQDTAARQYTEIIINEVERLEVMVRDIEEYLKFAKSRPTSFAKVDLTEILAKLSCEFHDANETDGKIDIEMVHKGGQTLVYGDMDRLIELFRGLLANASEAMPKGGKIAIRILEKAGWVKVEVEDGGTGIAQSDIDEMFNPFFTSKTKGAGLGLAKAFMIVEDHEGDIHFESEPGKGTICSVSIPVDRRRVFKRTGH